MGTTMISSPTNATYQAGKGSKKEFLVEVRQTQREFYERVVHAIVRDSCAKSVGKAGIAELKNRFVASRGL